jgi:glycosyltransferase involved in cell wall biosynthesis
MNSPKISIVTISYNRAGFLPEALESAIAQTFTDWELLIVDDGSTDNTREVAEGFIAKDERIRYYKNETNLKISRSRNRGLELARGKYVAMLDSDDIWCDPDKLSKQYEFLESHPDHALVGGGVIAIDADGKELKRYIDPSDDEDLRKLILIRNPFAQSSVMFPRQAIMDLGAYDVDLSGIEDYDLWMRIGIKWKFAILNEYLLKYRVHSGNISLTDRANTMRRNILLVNKYKDNYPNYLRAILRRTVRYHGYRVVSLIKNK